jgi:hypothetical protein
MPNWLREICRPTWTKRDKVLICGRPTPASMPNRQFNPHHNPSAIPASPILLDSPTTSYIDELLATTPLPPPGPAYYLARRKLWLTPRSPRVPCLPDYSASRQRLQAVLSEPNVVHDDDAWRNGIEKVWKGLSGGGKLKQRLPMSLIVCSSFLTIPSIIIFTSYQDQNCTCSVAS